MTKKDVTKDVEFGDNDGEYLPLKKCVCGQIFTLWNFTLGLEKADSHMCPTCGRVFVFEFDIKVYEIKD